MKDNKLECLFQKFTEAMRERLEEKEQAGFTGWDIGDFHSYGLVERMNNKASYVLSMGKACGKKTLVDIANFAMFLWGKI